MGPMIQWMQQSHFPEILKIENESFEFSWEEEDFLQCLADEEVAGMVASVDDQIVGYIVYSSNEKAITILNIAVDEKYRRKGFASSLIRRLIDRLSPQGKNKIVALVRESNLFAQLFLRKLEFLASNIIKEHYDCISHYEDAYAMCHTK